MTVEQLRAVREADSFHPLTITLDGGATYRVTHRDYLSMSPSGRTLIVYRNDSFSILDLLRVTEVAADGPGSQPNRATA